MERRLAQRQNRHRRPSPGDHLVGGKQAAVSLRRGAVEPLQVQRIDSNHKLVPCVSRTPFSRLRCKFGKGLFTSSRAAFPASI